MALSSKALLQAKLRKDKQRRKQGITDETRKKLEAQRAQEDADKAQAQATKAAKPEQREVTVSPRAASLLAKVKKTKSNTVWRSDIKQDTPPPSEPVLEATAPTGENIEVALTVHTGEQPLGKNQITLDMFNAEQLQAVQFAREKKSFCLIGGAGTGKTTTQRGAIDALVSEQIVTTLAQGTEKVLTAGAPAVAVLSFTNKAVANIKAALPQEFKSHCATMHKILEYAPEEFEEEVVDSYGSETGEVLTRRRFVPRYGQTANGEGGGLELPHLDVVIIEEAGSVPTDLFNILLRALPCHEDTVFIFLGDLNQLPPVFGDAILGYSLLDLPVVELKQVYRQALLSPITTLATTIQKGRAINDAAMADMAQDNGEHGRLDVIPFNPQANRLTKSPEDKEKMAHNFGKHLYKMTIDGDFDPELDVVLIPFNKQFGTIELNKWVGQALRDMGNLTTYHVRAGREEYFLCEGDRVMYEKQECTIIEINQNEKYLGDPTIVASPDLDRWGRNRGTDILKKEYKSFDEMADLLDSVALADGDDKVNQSSHVIVIKSLETGEEFEAKTSAQLNTLLPLNVLTVHKSQGSEWRKVILVMHASHAGMWSRELLYTAVTRARHHLQIYYTGEQRGKINGSCFQRGVIKSEFNGITLNAKLDYFRNKRKAALLNEQAAQRKIQREYEQGVA